MISKALRIHESTVARHLREYVKEAFGLSYTVSGIYKWLHHNGFSY